MLTIEQVLRATKAGVIKKSEDYRVDSVHRTKGSDTEGTHLNIQCSISGGSQPENCLVQVFDSQISLKSKCRVYCTCKMFQFSLEVPLTAFGSSKLVRAQPVAPTKTNPNMIPGLCPHLALTLRGILQAENEKQKPKAAVKINQKLKNR